MPNVALPPALAHAFAAELGGSQGGMAQWSKLPTLQLHSAIDRDAALLASRLAPGGRVFSGIVRFRAPAGAAGWFDPATGLFLIGEQEGRGFQQLAGALWGLAGEPLPESAILDRLAALLGRAALACLERGTLRGTLRGTFD